jgi:hypothetical protein
MDWQSLLKIFLELFGTILRTGIKFSKIAFVGIITIFKKGNL